jgi:hypothetical protein
MPALPRPVEPDDWSLDAVLERLRSQVGPDGRVRAHVFLDRSMPADMNQAAERLVRQAVGDSTELIEVENIRSLARSFAITATTDVIGTLGRLPGVRAILPAQVEDVYPRPVHSERA